VKLRKLKKRKRSLKTKSPKSRKKSRKSMRRPKKLPKKTLKLPKKSLKRKETKLKLRKILRSPRERDRDKNVLSFSQECLLNSLNKEASDKPVCAHAKVALLVYHKYL